MDSVIVKVPASTANLGSGFDCIGMAFQLYTTIRMERAETTSIKFFGENLEGLPTTKENLIYKVAKIVFEKAKLPLPELRIEVESEIPLTRGLGSSAAAIIGGLVAANELAGAPFSKDEIYHMATVLEGHPDNVGASLLGGIVIAAWNANEVSYIHIQPPTNMKILVAIPNFELQTERAREVLPAYYSKEDTVKAISHSALLAASLATGNVKLLYKAMDDVIHQPYRMSLIPGLEEILIHAKDYGALGVAISGAGPTVLAFVEDDEENLISFIKEIFNKHNVPCSLKIIYPDNIGVQVCQNQKKLIH